MAPPISEEQRENDSDVEANSSNSSGKDDDDDDDDDGINWSDEEEDDEEEDGHLDEDKDEDDEGAADATTSCESKRKRKKKIHKLSLTQTEDFNEKLKKRGVVYVARIPPRMTPTKIKTLLSVYGEVTRVYLVEEDASVRRRRRKLSGNGSKRYVEGWVEFANKKVAKHVATSLNTSAITNYKRSPHYGDLWALKYLQKFKWSHLTEKVAYERRVREQKLRLETMQARRETVAYKQLVETGKKLDKIEERKRRRAEKEGRSEPEDDDERKKKRRPPQLKQIDGDAGKSTKKSILGALVV